MIYVASPYSHPSALIRQKRYNAVLMFTGQLLLEGRNAISPIVYGHPFAEAGTMPPEHDAWISFNERLLSACSSIYVLKLFGWKHSRGIRHELDYAKKHEMEVIYFNGVAYEAL